MEIEFETFLDGQWYPAALAKIHKPDLGYLGPVTLDYHLDYFAELASEDYARGTLVRDSRALSVRLPVDLASSYTERWPSFLLDLMPQGHARRKLAEAMDLENTSPKSDLALLLRTGGSTIGNVRVAQAERAERKRLVEAVSVGVTFDEILDRSDRFMEVFDRFAMIASGSSGLQGEWPKVAMTRATDNLYYPDALVADDQACEHVIVKLVRSNKDQDLAILELEGLYSSIAEQLGLKVHALSTYATGVLIIPRFDRAFDNSRNLQRFGQESLVSAIGVSEFGYVGTHERYIDAIKEFSSNPAEDIAEYICRDIANLAMGNTDNHGRNTALGKYPDGRVGLTPLFDFAPMRLADENIVRSTRWACMKALGRDTSPDWKIVCATVYPDNAGAAKELFSTLQEFGARLDLVQSMLAEQMPRLEPQIRRALSLLDDIRRSLEISSSLEPSW